MLNYYIKCACFNAISYKTINKGANSKVK